LFGLRQIIIIQDVSLAWTSLEVATTMTCSVWVSGFRLKLLGSFYRSVLALLIHLVGRSAVLTRSSMYVVGFVRMTDVTTYQTYVAQFPVVTVGEFVGQFRQVLVTANSAIYHTKPTIVACITSSCIKV